MLQILRQIAVVLGAFSFLSELAFIVPLEPCKIKSNALGELLCNVGCPWALSCLAAVVAASSALARRSRSPTSLLCEQQVNVWICVAVRAASRTA